MKSHLAPFKDERTVDGLGLDGKSQRRMAKVKKLVAKK
jgi:hypothetical protein